MLQIKQSDLITVLGHRGYGKTALIKELLHILDTEHVEYVILDLLGKYRDRNNSIRFNPAKKESVDQLLRKLYNKHYYIVFDEADSVCKPKSMPTGMYDIINYGRNHGQGGVYSARRPFRLNRDLTANSDYLFLLGIRETKDIEYIADVATEDLARHVKEFQKFHYCVYDMEKGEIVYEGETAPY